MSDPPKVMELRFDAPPVPNGVPNGSRPVEDNMWTWLFYASLAALILFLVLK